MKTNASMKKIIIAILLLIIVGTVSVVILPQTLLKPKPVHFHAGVQVYKDEKLQDFSNFKYMHEAPCTVNGKPVQNAHEDEQGEKAHLHDHVGDVVHVHRINATWGDLFTNIKYPLDEKAVAYVNGKQISNILEQKIQPYESVVIFVGKHTDDQKYLKNAVTKKHIQDIEHRSETCSS
jgi:hypothetical protein